MAENHENGESDEYSKEEGVEHEQDSNNNDQFSEDNIP